MDSDIKQDQLKLQELFSNISELAQLSPGEKEEVFEKLNHSIGLRIINMALQELPEDQQQLFGQQDLGNADDLLRFLSKIMPQDRLRQIASQSVEYVVKDFLENI